MASPCRPDETLAARQFETIVVGAGILGLAVARELLSRQPGLRLGILEKEPRIAVHQTGRNSGVIHSGIYYAPGSLKAELCVRGAQLLKAYCDEHGIPDETCGKLIVAAEHSAPDRLHDLFRRGTANGVPGLEVVDERRIREIEPNAVGVVAVYSPTTAIVDFSRVADALAADVRRAGGTILTSTPVTAISRRHGAWAVATSAGSFAARSVVTCGGLYADRLARLTGGAADPRIVPFRGDYWVLRPQRRSLVKGLIYPVPDPALPFLGIHTTRRMNGDVWLGPNAVLAFAQEGYHFGTIRPAELAKTLAWPGFWRMARRYWRSGLAEFSRDLSKRAFVRQAQRYVPAIQPADVMRGPAGVRAQAIARDGRLIDDFLFSQDDGVLHVRNAPSPAATSCLVIAERIVDRFLGVLSGTDPSP